MASAAHATSATAPWRGDDFPAWLSPMLVKELRQGVNSGVFAWTFVGLQAAMFLVMAFTLAAGEPGGGAGQGLFWLPVTLAVGIVAPLRGLGAVAAERAGNNLDLVRLTHLSATRIVTGKWLAIVAQSALLATAVLPYLVLRYFLGGVDVIGNVRELGWLMVTATVVAAAAVAASTRPVRERIAVLILMFLVANGAMQAMLFRGRMAGGAAGFPSLTVAALACLATVLFLEYAAAAIAAPAENHAARKRLLGLVVAGSWAGAAVIGGPVTFRWIAGCTAAPLAFIAAEALCERPSVLTSVHAPFARWGAAGRQAALLLTPGWATGILFVVLVGTIVTAAAVCHAVRFLPGRAGEIGCLGGLACAAVIFPLPAVVLFTRTARQHLLYGAVQLVCLFVLVFHSLVGAGGGPGATPLAPLALFPPAAFLWAMGAGAATRFTLAGAAALVTAVVIGIVAGPWLREVAASRSRVNAARPPDTTASEALR